MGIEPWPLSQDVHSISRRLAKQLEVAISKAYLFISIKFKHVFNAQVDWKWKNMRPGQFLDGCSPKQFVTSIDYYHDFLCYYYNG